MAVIDALQIAYTNEWHTVISESRHQHSLAGRLRKNGPERPWRAGEQRIDSGSHGLSHARCLLASCRDDVVDAGDLVVEEVSNPPLSREVDGANWQIHQELLGDALQSCDALKSSHPLR